MDFLAAFSASVGEDSKAALGIRAAALLKRKLGGQRHHPSEQSLVLGPHLSHRGNVLFRDHQKMNRRPRIDVVKGKQLIVFVDFAARNDASGDFAKKAVVHAAIVAGLQGSLNALL